MIPSIYTVVDAIHDPEDRQIALDALKSNPDLGARFTQACERVLKMTPDESLAVTLLINSIAPAVGVAAPPVVFGFGVWRAAAYLLQQFARRGKTVQGTASYLEQWCGQTV